MTSIRQLNDIDRRLLLRCRPPVRLLLVRECDLSDRLVRDIFLPNWHIEAMAHALDRVRRGECSRLIINVPPRSLKSICASVALPAFILGHDPTRRIICVSYAEGLARKHANDYRALMRSTLYQQLFPQLGSARQGYRIGVLPPRRGAFAIHLGWRNPDGPRRQPPDP